MNSSAAANRLELWLSPIPSFLRRSAVDALERGDPIGLLTCAPRERSLELVAHNTGALRQQGIYEDALLHAFLMAPAGLYSQNLVKWLFELADRSKLLAAGDPLPSSGPFTLYQAISEKTRTHRLSWTDSLRGTWFAARGNEESAAVYRVTIGGEHVLAYKDGVRERKYLVLLPSKVRPARVKIARGAVPCRDVDFSFTRITARKAAARATS